MRNSDSPFWFSCKCKAKRQQQSRQDHNHCEDGSWLVHFCLFNKQRNFMLGWSGSRWVHKSSQFSLAQNVNETYSRYRVKPWVLDLILFHPKPKSIWNSGICCRKTGTWSNFSFFFPYVDLWEPTLFESVKNVVSFFECTVILLMFILSCKNPGNPLHCHQIRNSWLISPFIVHILPNVASFSRNRKIMSLRIYIIVLINHEIIIFGGLRQRKN